MNLEAEPYIVRTAPPSEVVRNRAPKVSLEPREQPGRSKKRQRVEDSGTEATANGAEGSAEGTPSSGIKGA